MTNPLLNPQGDRFQRPKLPADGGPFQEPAAAFEDAAITPPPQLPPETYATVYRSRGVFLAILAGCGLALQLSLLLMFFSFSLVWMFLAMAGGVPGLTASILAAGDIRAMRAGAMDPSGLGLTRAAFWLGVAAFVLSILAFSPVLIIFVILLF